MKRTSAIVILFVGLGVFWYQYNQTFQQKIQHGAKVNVRTSALENSRVREIPSDYMPIKPDENFMAAVRKNVIISSDVLSQGVTTETIAKAVFELAIILNQFEIRQSHFGETFSNDPAPTAKWLTAVANDSPSFQWRALHKSALIEAKEIPNTIGASNGVVDSMTSGSFQVSITALDVNYNRFVLLQYFRPTDSKLEIVWAYSFLSPITKFTGEAQPFPDIRN